MIFQGKSLSVSADEQGIATMCFDAQDESINKFDRNTLEEFRTALQTLGQQSSLKGLLVTSGKDSFVVGADIKEFHGLFANEESMIEEAVIELNQIFCLLEDLPMPTVALIDGTCLGGGMELVLACDYRIASSKTRIGLPEVKLGINPGFGGTVRLPRLIGIDNAVEWIATGKENRPDAALAVGAVDAIIEADAQRDAGIAIIEQCLQGKLDHQARRDEKTSPVKLNDMERLMAFTTAKGLVASQAGPHMPAPVTSVKSIEKSAALPREDAIKVEAKYFARLAKTDVSGNLIALFLNEQDLSKRMSQLSSDAESVTNVGVLGAGIMGGGIAYQSAYKGKKVVMKDIAQMGLDQGMDEATKLLAKRVSRGRMTAEKMASIISDIKPTLHYAEFSEVEVVVEAVVENLKVKQAVLAEAEANTSEDSVIASNTSTLSISKMAEGLSRPQNFCGMHFFNPVHRMPLVEVIRGEKSSDAAVASVVKLAKEMGKTPIVVNDCPGFFVNRVLFPYLAGFSLLLRDGLDFRHIDKVMEGFGWPMGPAYLVDVVGIDTACHAAAVMAEGFPTRMGSDGKAPVNLLHDAGRLGQKNGLGFYAYELDKKGKPKKLADDQTDSIIAPAVSGSISISDEEIIERMMIPMCFEVIRCLDENIVSDPIDADMGLLMGVGFPLFRGGALRYLESIGLQAFVDASKKYADLGELYHAPESLVTMAAEGKSFFC